MMDYLCIHMFPVCQVMSCVHAPAFIMSYFTESLKMIHIAQETTDFLFCVLLPSSGTRWAFICIQKILSYS